MEATIIQTNVNEVSKPLIRKLLSLQFEDIASEEMNDNLIHLEEEVTPNT